MLETRELLLRAGLAMLTEKGFSAAGLDEILSSVGVPKGSFYHYFKSKEEFGAELILRYSAYFVRKLEGHFLNQSISPLQRIEAFIADAKEGMLKYSFKRGCLIGRLGQEINTLPPKFRKQLFEVFEVWQCKLALCLEEARRSGELTENADCDQLAAFFWIGWEGAVLRASLEQKIEPLDIFAAGFFTCLPVR